MLHLRTRRPSPAMLVALIALVIAATGTAVAASRLVSGDSLIKKTSLSGNRLRKHTLAGTQINLNKLGKVPSAKKADAATTAVRATTAAIATDALTAVNAQNAATATSATHADAASTVDIIKKIDFRANASTPTTELLNTGKFRLTAACNAAGQLDLEAITLVEHADLQSYGNGSDTNVDDLLTAVPQKLNGAPPSSSERTVVYTEPGGQTVQLSYLSSDKTPFGGAVSSVKCLVSGFATIQ